MTNEKTEASVLLEGTPSLDGRPSTAELDPRDSMLLEVCRLNHAYCMTLIQDGLWTVDNYLKWSQVQELTLVKPIRLGLHGRIKGTVVKTLSATWYRKAWVCKWFGPQPEKPFCVAESRSGSHIPMLLRACPPAFHTMVDATETRLTEIRSALIVCTATQNNLRKLCKKRKLENQYLLAVA